MRRAGFTLLELLLIMALLGVLLGLGAFGVDRAGPGARGLAATLGTFLTTSRDRARASGQPVLVEILPPGAEDQPARIARYVYQPAIAASFEPRWREREDLAGPVPSVADPARAAVGRVGAALDLREGGVVAVQGRGRGARATYGFSLELDVYTEALAACRLLDWPELLTVELRRDGSVVALLRADARAGAGAVQLQSEPGALEPGRWQHLRLTAAEGVASLLLNGKPAAASAASAVWPEPRGAPVLGDPQGRFSGLMDEFILWVRAREEGPAFPRGVTAQMDPPQVRFDREGRLDAQHVRPVTVQILQFDLPVDRFVVGRFAEEMQP
ncbi:MAG: hypothetical protein EYC70_03220 [Planctomycetota bacterium]|nr:MAG: hypothetical protein EYC70_03220 [Planctomycetota bacterium]